MNPYPTWFINSKNCVVSTKDVGWSLCDYYLNAFIINHQSSVPVPWYWYLVLVVWSLDIQHHRNK